MPARSLVRRWWTAARSLQPWQPSLPGRRTCRWVDAVVLLVEAPAALVRGPSPDTAYPHKLPANSPVHQHVVRNPNPGVTRGVLLLLLLRLSQMSLYIATNEPIAKRQESTLNTLKNLSTKTCFGKNKRKRT